MADEIVLIIIALSIFALCIVAFSRENWDYISTAFLGCVILVVLVVSQQEHASFEFLGVIDFEAILFIFGMQLVVIIGEHEHVFEWVAIKMIRATKGNQRQFFYLTIILGTIFTAFVGDLAVALIFTPLIIKACRILEIPAGTYILCFVISIKMGTLLTPYSCAENFIAAEKLELSPEFFVINMGPLALLLLIITLYLTDRFILKKERQVAPERKLLLLELLDASVVIENKRRFHIATFGILSMFVCLFALPIAPDFLIVLIFGFILVLCTGRKMKTLFGEIEWNLIFFFIALFVLIGVLNELGFMQAIGDGVAAISGGNVVLASVFLFLFSSMLAAPLVNAPVILFFLPLIQVLGAGGIAMPPLAVGLILGTNIGSTFLPQGAPAEMMALQISKKFSVPNMSFRRLFRVGASITSIHFLLSLFYVVLYSLFYI